MRTLLIFAFLFLLILFGGSRSFASQVLKGEDKLSLVCESGDMSCQELCGSATQCEIASLTCESCARSADPAMIAIFKRFHRIYSRTESTVSTASFSNWIRLQVLVAIDAKSPLNIFADPFSTTAIPELTASFNKVCGGTGEHYVLAEQNEQLRPAAILCENKGVWQLHGLKYREDYYKSEKELSSLRVP